MRRNRNNQRGWLNSLKYILASMILFLAMAFLILYGKKQIAGDGSDSAKAEIEELSMETENTVEETAPISEDGYWDDICLQLDSGSVLQNIKLYTTGTNAYFFLPSCTSSCSFSLIYEEATYEILIDGAAVTSGAEISEQSMEGSHTLEIVQKGADGQTLSCSLQYMQSENLPAVFIETFNGTMEYINQSKSNEEPGELLVLTAEGETDSTGQIASIHPRGATSFTMANKKSYKFTLNEAEDLLDMGEGQEWVLIANAFDTTKIRNGMAYELARELGLASAVDTRYADVWFNGEYAGNYLIGETVEVGENRVKIDTESPGSYLLLTDRVEEGDVAFTDQYGRTYIFEYPKDSTEEDADYVAGRIELIENLIADCDTEEKYEVLKEYIDINSFVVMYLMDMVANEIDSNTYSSWYYMDGLDGKLYIGPAWDYDRAWGNNGDRATYVELDAFYRGFPEWLSDIPYFMEEVKEKISQCAELLESLPDQAEALADQIRSSVKMDSVINNDESSSPAEGFDTDLIYLRNYIGQRLKLTMDVIYHPENYYRIYVESRQTGKVYWLKQGETVPESVLNYLAARYECTGFRTKNWTIFEEGYPVMSDMVLYPYTDSSGTAVSNDTASASADQNAQISSVSEQSVASSDISRKETGMVFLSILILIAPGLITLGILSDFQFHGTINRESVCRFLLEYLIAEFFIFLFVYAVIYVVKGAIILSLSAELMDLEYDLYHTNVVFLFMLLELIGACGLGYGIRQYRKRRGQPMNNRE